MQISAPIGSDHLQALLAGKPSAPPRVVLAGHGVFLSKTDANYPKVRLPPSVTMVFWCAHGASLSDRLGQFLDANADINLLPETLAGFRSPDGRSVVNTPPAPPPKPEIVKGGEEIWNYRLLHPSGLTLGNAPASVPSSQYNPPSTANSATMPKGVVGDRRFVIVPPLNGGLADQGVPILALLAGHWNICDGATIHWCACRTVMDA